MSHQNLSAFLLFTLLVSVQVFGQDSSNLQQRALAGDVNAMMALGMQLYNGEGAAKKPEEAFLWLYKAAEEGHPDAMYSVALMYTRGIGTSRSTRKAATWVSKAANLGHANAQNVLATLYQTGNGVIKSFPEAFKWRTQAALSGLPDAQMALANHYKYGDIVGQDLVQAYAWFNIADSTGTANARVNREIIGQKLSAVQLAEAQTLSGQLAGQVSRIPPPLPAIHGGKIQEIAAAGQLSPATPASPAIAVATPVYVPPTPQPAVNPSQANSSFNTPFPGRNFTIPGLDLEMIWVRPGTFQMGSPKDEPGRVLNGRDETQHTVTLTKGYWLGKYEVTQGQWKQLMGNNPSYFKGDNLPVEQVGWNDVKSFCGKLNESQRGRLAAGYQYNLPTEAQWEYACRAGTTTATAFGESLSSHQANFNGSEPYGVAPKGSNLGRTASVGSYSPNAWGFYDMHGNVWECCEDWYGLYPTGRVFDPAGSTSGTNRVLRGGGLNVNGSGCRSALRSARAPGYRSNSLGLRLALSSNP